jgi:hypothetical protein
LRRWRIARREQLTGRFVAVAVLATDPSLVLPVFSGIFMRKLTGDRRVRSAG